MPTKSVIVAALVAGVVAIGCGSGGGSSGTEGAGGKVEEAVKSQEPAIPTVGIGGAITLTDSGDEVVITLTKAELHPTGPDEYIQPKGEFIVADFQIVVNKGTYAANPFNFTAIPPDNTRVSTDAGWFEPALGSLEMVAGQTTAGKVTFDVPKGTAAKTKIAVSGLGLMTRDAGYWALG